MTQKEDRLLAIAKKVSITKADIEYFKDQVEDYFFSWGNLYLWSIECENYELSDYILSLGFIPKNDSQVYDDMIHSFKYNRRYIVKRIIHDGFIVDKQFINSVRSIIPDSEHFDYELFQEIILEYRNRKVLKVLGRIFSG